MPASRRSRRSLVRFRLTRIVGVAAIFVGVAPFLGVGVPLGAALVVGGLALLTGLDRRLVGTLLLSAWLIASGALSLVTISVPFAGTLLSVLAVVAGALVLLDR